MKLALTLSTTLLCLNGFSQAWLQRADLSGNARWGSCGFSIGDKGYLCTGTDGQVNFADL